MTINSYSINGITHYFVRCTILRKRDFKLNECNLFCQKNDSREPDLIEEATDINSFFDKMRNLYESSTRTAEYATQFWADIAVKSQHPLAPLAHVPGVFSALWTPDVAPTTALTLGTAGYGFAALPKSMTHFTTATGSAGIVTSGAVNATRFGLFGPGVYMTNVGRPINLFVRANARTPISLKTPQGTVRIFPKLVYVRWGRAPVILP